MASPYYRRQEVEEFFDPCSWQASVFREFSTLLLSKTHPFPCVFGVAGFEADQLRFGFIDRMDSQQLSLILQDYLKMARKFGPNTSLVAFSSPGPIRSLESYQKRFWTLLRDLSSHDPAPWPSTIPERLDDPAWEFCFAGEPIFVVCNTPAHMLRQSRYASTFMTIFQPRWVFDSILRTPRAANKAFDKVRRRLAAYDTLPPSPALGRYGDVDVREHQQYFLSDDNEPPKCPFATLRREKPMMKVEMEKVA